MKKKRKKKKNMVVVVDRTLRSAAAIKELSLRGGGVSRRLRRATCHPSYRKP